MKKSRNYRNKKKHLSSKYLLLILSGVCIMAIFVSLVFNISGGPLNAVAGYVFGDQFCRFMDFFKGKRF